MNTEETIWIKDFNVLFEKEKLFKYIPLNSYSNYEKMNSMMRQAQRNYTGSFVSGSLGGVGVENKSYKKFYSNPGYRMPKI